MIKAVHTIVYADEPDRARDFFRDALGFAHLDVGDGWLIFKTGPSEMGIHPTDSPESRQHQISLVCDDLEATVSDLRAKGVEFTQEPRNEGWGVTTMFVIPGGGEMMLYEPRHPAVYDLE